MKNDYRFYEIDLLRFLAALSVLFFHYTFCGYAAANMTVLSFNHLGSFTRYGYLGFHLFFMISGFVILLSAYNKTGLDFIISRMLRLYPAYWFCVTLTFITILVLGGSRYQASISQYLVNLTMIQKFLKTTSIDPVYWTLMVELKFYFIIFILIYLKQLHRINLFLGLWVGLSLIMTRYNIKYLNALLIPEYSCYFIAGSCFYLLYRERNIIYYSTLIFITYLLALHNAFIVLPPMGKYYNVEFNSMIISLYISCFYIIFYLISFGMTSKLNSKHYLFFGSLTYPLYLIHQIIGFMLFNYLFTYLNKYLILLSVTSIMLLIAYAINKLIEKRYSNKFKLILIEISNRLFRKKLVSKKLF